MAITESLKQRRLHIAVVDISTHGKSDGTNKTLLWDLTGSGEVSNRHREELGVTTNPSARHSTAFFEELLLERNVRPEEIKLIITVPSNLPDVTKRNSKSKTVDAKAPTPTQKRKAASAATMVTQTSKKATKKGVLESVDMNVDRLYKTLSTYKCIVFTGKMSQKHTRAKVESALKDKWHLTVRTKNIPTVINDKDERKVLLVYSEAAKEADTAKYRQASKKHVETMQMTKFEKLVDDSSLMML